MLYWKRLANACTGVWRIVLRHTGPGVKGYAEASRPRAVPPAEHRARRERFLSPQPPAADSADANPDIDPADATRQGRRMISRRYHDRGMAFRASRRLPAHPGPAAPRNRRRTPETSRLRHVALSRSTYVVVTDATFPCCAHVGSRHHRTHRTPPAPAAPLFFAPVLSGSPRRPHHAVENRGLPRRPGAGRRRRFASDPRSDPWSDPAPLCSFPTPPAHPIGSAGDAHRPRRTLCITARIGTASTNCTTPTWQTKTQSKKKTLPSKLPD